MAHQTHTYTMRCSVRCTHTETGADNMQPESRSCVQPGVRQLFMECGCDSELSSNTSPDEHIKEVLASAMSLQIEMGTVWSFVFDLQSGVRTVKIACRSDRPLFLLCSPMGGCSSGGLRLRLCSFGNSSTQHKGLRMRWNLQCEITTPKRGEKRW